MKVQRTYILSILAFFLSPLLAHALSAPGVQLESDTFVRLAKKVNPSVVNISTLTSVKSNGMRGGPDEMLRRMFEDFWRRGGGLRGLPEGTPNEDWEGSGDEDSDSEPQQKIPHFKGKPSGAPKMMSLGTGFVIDASGLILTNNHVVAEADEIKISFTEAPDEKPTDGEVVGRDPELDIALIRVKTKHELTPLVLGDSEAVEVGEMVMAVGNPFGQGHTVTDGLVSAIGRPAPDFPLANYIQTNAAINPGNSGGPLVNLKGEVIGINNAIDQRAQGIGFAIASHLIKRVLPQLKTKGVVARGYIGVQVAELTPEIAKTIKVSENLHAPFVTHVFSDGPSAAVGVQTYDVILEFNGKPIHTSAELISSVVMVEVGQSVPMKILHEGKERTVQIKVAQRPGAPQLAQKSKPPGKKPTSKAKVNTGMTLVARGKELVIQSVVEDSPADQAGLMKGDVILEVDRHPVKDPDVFYTIVKEHKSYLVRVRRTDAQGREVFSVVVLDLKQS